MIRPGSILGSGTIAAKKHTGWLPIASSIMPDASKYYVSNYLDSTITCISIVTGACKNDARRKVWTSRRLRLLVPGTGTGTTAGLANYDPARRHRISRHQAACRFRRLIAPDGKFVITANTLTATITIIDTKTDKLVGSAALERRMPWCELRREDKVAGTMPMSRASSRTT